jgi:hypothetical protein
MHLQWMGGDAGGAVLPGLPRLLGAPPVVGQVPTLSPTAAHRIGSGIEAALRATCASIDPASVPWPKQSKRCWTRH